MKIATRIVLLGALSTVGMAVPVAAQDVSFGYQFQRITDDPGLNLPAGFNVDASFPLGSGGLRALGQVDWSRKSESGRVLGTSYDAASTLTAYGGGVRWATTGGGASPFAQVVIGAMRSSFTCSVASFDICGDSSSTDLMMQIGGGVAVSLSSTVAIVGQFDYRRIFFEGEAGNTVRFVGGIRLGVSR